MALKDNLISSWELDEASGNAIDSHGSNTLTETGGTIGASTGPGGFGGSRDMEMGDTEGFEITSNSTLQMGDFDFSIECWVNIESLGTTQDFVSKGSSVTPLEYFVGYAQPTGRLRFVLYDAATGTTPTVLAANTFGAPTTGVWYHIVSMYDAAANQMSIRVNNGTADTASLSGGTYIGTNTFKLGARDIGGNSNYDGLISKVRVWKRLLTSDEITQLYNNGNGLSYISFDPVVIKIYNSIKGSFSNMSGWFNN